MSSQHKVVAVVYNPDGTVYDECWTWETAQTFAANNNKVVAVADDGHMTVTDQQRLYDWEAGLYQDCFSVKGYSDPREESE